MNIDNNHLFFSYKIYFNGKKNQENKIGLPFHFSETFTLIRNFYGKNSHATPDT
jgi:hypothetical protein